MSVINEFTFAVSKRVVSETDISIAPEDQDTAKIKNQNFYVQIPLLTDRFYFKWFLVLPRGGD